MQATRRFAVLSTALATAVSTALALAPASAGAVPVPELASVHVHGRLVVAETDGVVSRTSYAVQLAGGDIVPVRGPFDASVRTGAVFDGRLALPASVASVAISRGAALRIVDRRSLSLSVIGTPSVTAVAPAATPVAHQQFVAAIDNKGALGQTDPTLLAHVSTVGGYWQAESNGAISGLGVPATVTHYNTAVATTDCGLGGDFFTLVQEAEQK
jgi:hypothetical protein